MTVPYPYKQEQIIELPLFLERVPCGFPSPAVFPSDYYCQYASKY